MPAIKNLGLRILFSAFLLPAFFSCDKKKAEQSLTDKNSSEITFISVSNIGGKLGQYRIIKVTRDSITAEKGITARKTHKKWNSAISAETWKRLASSVRVKDLDKIKSSPSMQSIDGLDETFQIRTPKKSHLYVNSYVDTIHYQQFQHLKDQINQLLPQEYQ